jgi:hypothetical protein
MGKCGRIKGQVKEAGIFRNKIYHLVARAVEGRKGLRLGGKRQWKASKRNQEGAKESVHGE